MKSQKTRVGSQMPLPPLPV